MLPYRSRLSVLVFLTPPVLLFGGGVLLPIVQSLVLSFYKWDGITNMQFVGVDNYIKMFSADPTFWKAFVNQLVYLVICVVIQMGLGLGVALLLLTITRGREVLKVLYLMPAVISTTAIALLFQRIYSFDPKGLVNTILGMVGLDGIERPWLSNIHTVLTAVSIPEGWRFLGLYTIIFYAALLSVPRELEEAAQLDGASAWKVFVKIRFPHIRPVWATTMVMVVTYGLRGFDIPYLLTNGGPGQSSELVTTYMYKTAFVSTNYGYASAISVFIVLECLVAVAFIFGLIRRGND
ncbi:MULTISPECIES: carbohydrate ABC transporter permease [Actinomyces]|jgi:putative ABC-type sugar transport system, permease component|uniref:Sugar ABC transporter permease n=1 Tax=Actinomyces oris TaxID=544580 RepID=A0AAW8LGW1_9ACTO|nr:MULTISPECIES: sugar ABC transporter permease [Actinomyces]MDR0178103.1 sugar ABC transporter permease [Actinomyces oris]OLO59831.1 sugar ABC transporter permease [Actinomyces oris]OLO67186.1 sugar ABC transporter permease [Actinomyces oris]OLO79494.1 sugar ABC transporter permease [Actinomyces oris]OMG34825.1 sugar ABC transporter permease [Actinomyces naeslundii]